MADIIDLITNYTPFFTSYLQNILDSFFESSPLVNVPAYSDSTSAFITSLLPMLRRKIFASLPHVAGQPQLLSHFVHELINFDTVLRDEWSYDPLKGATEWKGITWEVLVAKDWFGRWLQVEKDCTYLTGVLCDVLFSRSTSFANHLFIVALSRYKRIIEARDAGEIDYDTVEPGRTKPAKAAVRVNDLLETITGLLSSS